MELSPQSQMDFIQRLQTALQASWDGDTAYKGLMQRGNPAFAQCYPTSRVVKYYLPQSRIVVGKVWTGKSSEVHFWNALPCGQGWQYLDLTWQQFPAGSKVTAQEILDEPDQTDSEATEQRIALLLKRVKARLADRSL